MVATVKAATAAVLWKRMDRVQATIDQRTTGGNPILDAIRRDPTQIMRLAGMTPDPWQARILSRCFDRLIILASRQVGKSETAGALALREALLRPGALVLILSPSLRQSSELFKAKVLPVYSALGRPLAATRSTLRM